MTLSMYGQYISERTNRGILEVEHGFATFEYLPGDIVYIIDLFVEKEYRKEGIAAKMADTICEQALKEGKKYLLGSVDVNAKGAAGSHKALEAYGMKPFKEANPMIFYIKQLEQEILQEVSNG